MDELAACPVCGNPGDRWAEVSDRHYGNEGTWTVDVCATCDARYLNPMPTERELGAFYPDTYYSHQPVPASGTGWRARLRRVVLPIGTREPDFDGPGSMVDLGCGSGWTLQQYADQGWDAVGVEYSESACKAGAALGRTIVCGSLADADLPTAGFDYVRSNHSFEHLNEPHAVLEEMSRILKPGGTLFIGVPDSSGLMSKLFRSEWYYVGAPVHTINYNRRNLRSLLERHGFEVSRVALNSTHGGTIGSLQSWVAAKRGRRTRLDAGPVTKPPLILLGFWVSRLLDLLRLGDCVEITARKRSDP